MMEAYRRGIVMAVATLTTLTACSSNDEATISAGADASAKVCDSGASDVGLGPVGAAPRLDYPSLTSLADLKALSATVAIVRPLEANDREIARSPGNPEEGDDTAVWFGRRAQVVDAVGGPIENEILLVRLSYETKISYIGPDGQHSQERIIKAPPCGALPLASGYIQPFDSEAYLVGLVATTDPSLPKDAWQPVAGPGGIARLEEGAGGLLRVVSAPNNSARSVLESRYSERSAKELLDEVKSGA